MRRTLTALVICFALAPRATSVTAQDVIQFRYMGDLTCGGWRSSAPGNFGAVPKAVLLNWVLGFLVGRTAERGDDLLATVQISSIAAWLDDYCERQPLESLIKAAFDLEKELLARRRG